MPRPMVNNHYCIVSKLSCRRGDLEQRWGPTNPTSVDGRPRPTTKQEPFLEILAKS